MDGSDYFCKKCVMEQKLNAAYAQFVDLMTDEKLYVDPNLTFRQICAWLDVSVRALDGVLTQELGVTGEEFLATCRGHLWDRLEEKYHIPRP